MKANKIILIGGSAGSYDLITQILEVIPNPVDCAICVIIHRNPLYLSKIEKILSNKHKRSILLAEEKMEIQPNHIYFAPPAYHLLVEPNLTFSLDSSEPVNYSRPSIDVLFESCAQIFKQNCTAFLFSGANSDGAKGLKTIEDFQGETYIQHPNEAPISTMPNAAIKLSTNAQILSNQQIINYFNSLI